MKRTKTCHDRERKRAERTQDTQKRKRIKNNMVGLRTKLFMQFNLGGAECKRGKKGKRKNRKKIRHLVFAWISI